MGKFHCRCRKRQPHSTVNTTCISISYLPCLSYLVRCLVTCKFTTQTGATSCVCPYLSHSFGHRFTNLRIQTEPHDHTVCVCVCGVRPKLSDIFYIKYQQRGFVCSSRQLSYVLSHTYCNRDKSGCSTWMSAFLRRIHVAGDVFYLQAELMIFQCIKTDSFWEQRLLL